MVGIGIVLLLFGLIIGISVPNHAAHGNHYIQGLIAGMAVILIITGIAVFVLSVSIQSCLFLLIIYFSSYLQVIIVKLTFKLARVIDANQRLIIQQA
jgi:hypothetical protein